MAAHVVAASDWVSQYDVVWNTQSKDSSASMPLVGGNMGCNVWVEDNELLFYFASPGCRDENGALLKYGRVRIRTEPNIFKDAEFEQQLFLKEGYIRIKTYAEKLGTSNIKLWVEINNPIIHVDMKSDSKVLWSATYENWRTEPLLLPDQRQGVKFLPHFERSLGYSNLPGREGEAYTYNDEFQPSEYALVFFHRMRNGKSFWGLQMDQQELREIEDQLHNPVSDLTFGGMMMGSGFRFVKEVDDHYISNSFKGFLYQTKATKTADIRIVTHIAQTETLGIWQKQLNALAAKKTDRETLWRENLDWWDAFWQRSHIMINAGKGQGDEGWEIGRNYNLFRYMLVSGFYATEPLMFNGGVLTFDAALEGKQRYADSPESRLARYGSLKFEVQGGPGYTPDYRRWGAAFTAQNQRLIYWPMLKNGDIDGILPVFDWYLRNLQNTKAAAWHYFGIDGCMNAEQPNMIGLIGMSEYGWAHEYTKGMKNKSRSSDNEKGIPSCGIRYIFLSQLEFSWMMLEYGKFSRKDISRYLPFVEQSVIFFDEFYRMKEKERTGKELLHGKLHFSPSNALEGNPGAENPSSVIAGMTAVLSGLLALPDTLQSEQKKQRWRSTLVTLPSYPIGVAEGQAFFKIAANKEIRRHKLSHAPSLYPLYPFQLIGLQGDQQAFFKIAENKEYREHKIACAPALYTLYPFQIFGLGKDLELIKNTLEQILAIEPSYSQTSGGWNQNLIHYARIGDTDTAKRLTIDKIENGPFRFPAFFPGGDYAPDHNVGGAGMIGLQEMLLQTHHNKLHILPAWPQDWDVDYKLHAHRQTVVSCCFQDGVIRSLDLSRAKRKADVVTYHEALAP